MYQRPINDRLLSRLNEPRRFIQVLAGPRQVGKTTSIQQVMENIVIPSHYVSADTPTLQERSWIEAQWEAARLKISGKGVAVLVIDEVQKIPGWSAVVKKLWDEDSRRKRHLHVVLLGSSPLLMQKGLTESLAGRFETISATHWSYAECRDAFGWDLNTYIYFGGYPGAAPLIGDPGRWSRYIIDSIIETTVSRDILLMTRVDKPALLRRLFQLGCAYSGQILSYQKMLGQLLDAGNTITLAHYLELLSGSGLLAGISKYSGAVVRQRGSSPKLQVMNTALISAQGDLSFAEAIKNRDYWGRLVESAVGAHLLNSIREGNFKVYYWRDVNREVDFIVTKGSRVLAIEVKSGRAKGVLSGMDAFGKVAKNVRKLFVGGDGIGLEDFLLMPLYKFFE